MENNGILSRQELIETQKVQVMRDVAQTMRAILNVLQKISISMEQIERKHK
jgi:hypothetical protein